MKNYRSNLILLGSILLGALLGLFWGPQAVKLKPLGDLFLGLLLTAVVPYVFFSITSAVASIPSGRRLGKVMGTTLLVFIFTGIISSVLMILVVNIFPPHLGLESATLGGSYDVPQTPLSELLLSMLTTTDFIQLFSKKNLMPLIVFSLLLGQAISLSKEAGRSFLQFFDSGTQVMAKVMELIMLYAPIGLFSYFAYLVGAFGPSLLGTYARSMAIYYPVAIIYFFGGFSLYVAWAKGFSFISTFWKNVFPATLTALATGSSVATLPINLAAAEKNGIPKDIRELVLPIGATMHMDGSCLSAILKISLLLGIYQGGFTGIEQYVIAIGVAILSSTVMAGIPGGGFLGEILILNLYHFPPESYAILLAIGTLVDPIATVLNSIGDNVAALMVNKCLGSCASSKI